MARNTHLSIGSNVVDSAVLPAKISFRIAQAIEDRGSFLTAEVIRCPNPYGMAYLS